MAVTECEYMDMLYMYFWLINKEESDPCSNEHYISSNGNKVRNKTGKNSGLYGIWTHDLCDTGAVLHQLSQQANWELVIMFIRAKNEIISTNTSKII